MNAAELANFDGREQRPAYVAVSGVIYDVNASNRWRAGNHEGMHQAGQDLTEALKSAPHVRAVIERFPQVGTLTSTAAVQPRKKPPLTLLIGGGLLLLVLIILARLL